MENISDKLLEWVVPCARHSMKRALRAADIPFAGDESAEQLFDLITENNADFRLIDECVRLIACSERGIGNSCDGIVVFTPQEVTLFRVTSRLLMNRLHMHRFEKTLDKKGNEGYTSGSPGLRDESEEKP